MYYIIYGFFYLLSLIPWRILYFLSDGFYVLFYYVLAYRKDVVLINLAIAFPEKTHQERIRIAKEFYKNFIDTFIETIKFLSLNDKGFNKRMTGNFEVLNELYKTGQNVQLHGGHFFNWEYMNWGFARNTTYPLIGVYAPISNKAVDRILLKMRSRYNTILVNAYNFRNTFHEVSRGRYALALAADQNPPSPEKSFWINFFGQPTAFFMGPEKGARSSNTAVAFVFNYKVKRGYYKTEIILATTTPNELPVGKLTADYVSFLEECIRRKPSNYLWSHRRWKHKYNESYSKNVIGRINHNA